MLKKYLTLIKLFARPKPAQESKDKSLSFLYLFGSWNTQLLKEIVCAEGFVMDKNDSDNVHGFLEKAHPNTFNEIFMF